MNFANLLLETTRMQATRLAENASSDLMIGTMGGDGSVSLESGYTISGDLVEFSQFCEDQVIELPYKDHQSHSHSHDESLELTDAMGVTPAGPVSFLPAGTVIDPSVFDDPAKIAELMAQGVDTLSLKHKHTIQDALPKIRLWRGVKDGDRVLVLKVNTRHFVVLCRLGKLTNEEDSGGRGYVSFDS